MEEDTFVSQADKILSEVKHPYISKTLKELGILKSSRIDGKTVTVTLAYPFEGIPIKDEIEQSVRKLLEEIGASVEITAIIMSQKELQEFLSMEQAAWTG